MKRFLIIPGLLFSVCTYASPCNNSTIQIANNSDYSVVIEDIHASSWISLGGIVSGITKNQIIEAHTSATAMVSSKRWTQGMANGEINLAAAGSRTTVHYHFRANPFGWASTCKVKGTADNVDNFNPVINFYSIDGNPGSLQIEIRNPGPSS